MNAPLLQAKPGARLARPSAIGVKGGTFLTHVHCFRGLAITLVVAAHVWPCFAWSARQENGLLVLLDNVTVLFMFVSGFLFQHLSPRFEYRGYLKRRMRTVMLPYCIVSIPAIVMTVFVSHREDVWPWVYRLPAWEQILFFLATGRHLAPLWFMPMMALFIVAAPLFVTIDRRRLYGVLLPITVALATWLGRDAVPGIANVLGKAIFMLPAYLAGMAFSRYRIACEAWCEKRWPIILALLACVSATIASRAVPLDLGLIQKLLMAPLGLMLTRRIPEDGRLAAILSRLATLSFGIYFVHGYLISAARILCAHFEAPGLPSGTVFAPSFVELLAMIAAVTIASAAIVELVRLVAKRHSRMLIGA